MKKNIGKLDRYTRIIIAIIIATLYFTNVISGTIAYILIVVSVILLVTSFINFCPLYKIIGLKTNKGQ